jgi:hypothetical protein
MNRSAVQTNNLKKGRGARQVCEAVEKRLLSYAAAAGAAGVGMLALTQPAQGKIVYTQAHIPININGGIAHLDLNHDGINDFQFYAFYSLSKSGVFIGRLVVTPAQHLNRGLSVHTSHGLVCAVALPKGRTIGPRGHFQPGKSNLIMAATSGDSHGQARYCPWVNLSQAYLGLKFVINGKFHFGWARVNKKPSYIGPATITGYAYETIPGKPIIAGATKSPDDVAQPVPATHTSPTPEPATLGMLALGAPGLSIWRREEPVAATSDRN